MRGGEIQTAKDEAPFTIAGVLPGFCWLSPRLIGSTDEEAEAIAAGTVAPERLKHLTGMTQVAIERLSQLEVLAANGEAAMLS